VRKLVSLPLSIQGMSERMRSMVRLAEDETGGSKLFSLLAYSPGLNLEEWVCKKHRGRAPA
jgi:hypothetical protein